MLTFIFQLPEQNFPGAEADFDTTFESIKSARSVIGLYNLPTNGKTVEDKITGEYLIIGR